MNIQYADAAEKPEAHFMNAAVIAAPGRVEIQRVPLPQPKPNEVRVRLEGCGVCASNIPVWEGKPWFQYPFAPGAPGHEGWGYVDKVGDEVNGFSRGDRVAVLSSSAYAEYDVAPATAVVKLPSSLNGAPFPAEPLGCAMNVFRRSGIREGDTVAMVGVGFLGAVLTRLISCTGARVIAIAQRPYSLEIASKMGAWKTLQCEDSNAILKQTTEATGGKLCDVVIEATGKQEPLDLAAQLTRERGRLVIAGYHQDGLRHVNLQLWNWRGLDVINAHEREAAVYTEGIRLAVEAVQNGVLDPSALLTHVFPLCRLGEALDMAASRPPGFVKALISFDV